MQHNLQRYERTSPTANKRYANLVFLLQPLPSLYEYLRYIVALILSKGILHSIQVVWLIREEVKIDRQNFYTIEKNQTTLPCIRRTNFFWWNSSFAAGFTQLTIGTRGVPYSKASLMNPFLLLRNMVCSPGVVKSCSRSPPINMRIDRPFFKLWCAVFDPASTQPSQSRTFKEKKSCMANKLLQLWVRHQVMEGDMWRAQEHEYASDIFFMSSFLRNRAIR